MRRPLAFLTLLLLAAPAGAAEPTGRWLAVIDGSGGKPARASGVDAVLSRAGVHRAGPGAPRLGVATVDGPAAAIGALRGEPSVRSVSREWRRDLRRVPNDPALSSAETAPGTPAGVVQQWFLGRENFPAAWDVTTGRGATVGVIDSGIDGSHPELAGKVIAALEVPEGISGTGALRDENGHGTHVSGLACAATDDGIATAGAGWDCGLAFVKAPLLRDEDVIRGLIFLADRRVSSINMSFGGGPATDPLSQAEDYAIDRGVLLVAAASNNPDTDQGAPASQLQPGDGPDITKGRGLVVTGADWGDRNPATGVGPQISLAAYGFLAETTGPPGLLSTYTGALTQREIPPALCGCRTTLGADNRYAYLEGTSMAAPQVAALGALVQSANPTLSVQQRIRVIKETARRPGGAWTPELGWGIIDAGAAVSAARAIDATAPASRAHSTPRATLKRVRRRLRAARVKVSWGAADPPGAAGLIPSGVTGVEIYERKGPGPWRRIGTSGSAAGSLTRRIKRPGTYGYYTAAVDRAGNREAPPAKADATARIRTKRPASRRRGR